MAGETITIDGALGEGGGQVLRTSIGLAAALGRAVRIERVRAARPKPGLRAQHLAAVRAAAAVCGADVSGAVLGSRELTFRPGRVAAGEYRFDIGTAGSTTLVLQTVLPALMLAEGDSQVTVTGGSHNPMAPCFEYLRDVFAVLAAGANAQVYLELHRVGFYPAGGGRVRMQVRGVGSAEEVRPLCYRSRGAVKRVEGLSIASRRLPGHIVERQARRAAARLSAAGQPARIERARRDSDSPGTAVFLRAVFARSVAGASALGARGKPAERVADEAVEALLAFLASEGGVDVHAADQLITLAALSRQESVIRAERPTSHLRTNADVIAQITGREVRIEPAKDGSAVVTVAAC